MDKPKDKSTHVDRTEQLERVLRVYMHEISHLAYAVNHSVYGITQIANEKDVLKTAFESSSENIMQARLTRFLNEITDSVEMMNFMADNIRIGMELSSIDFDACDVHVYKEIIFKLKQTYHNEIEFKKLSFNTPQVTYLDDPKIALRTSKYTLEQLIHNLISNAVKFSYYGTNIHVSCNLSESVSGSCAIKVIDYGSYIEESARPYELFYRGKEGALKEGAGLGLFVAKKCAERLGGSIRHNCRLVSEYNIPLIIEFNRRFSVPGNEEFTASLSDEFKRLKLIGLFDRVVSQYDFCDASDHQVKSEIYIPTYETIFEVII